MIREGRKTDVIAALRNRKAEDGKAVTIKNLKFKHLPLDMRPKRTRAIRRRLTKYESKLVTLRVLKRRLNFPKRTFAVPLQ